MKTLFVPGCTIKSYKPELLTRVSGFLSDAGIIDEVNFECCKSHPKIEKNAVLITCCPGCSHQFETDHPHLTVLSLWSVLLKTDFPFPDYHGERMSIHDSCLARNRNSAEIQNSARKICEKMNIKLIEPEYTGDNSRCCGGSAADLETRRKMAMDRAGVFQEKNVVTYCTGCVRSFSLTDVTPRYLLDLLFEEQTGGLYPPGFEKQGI